MPLHRQVACDFTQTFDFFGLFAMFARPMYLGRVIGTCVASRKTTGLGGVKLLLVQPLDRQRNPKGRIQVATDTVRAGPGELVFLVGAREAAQAMEEPFVPVDAAIVGIVDAVEGK